MSDISKAIKYWRELKGMTQKELGKKAHIDENSISHYENDRRVPTIETIFLLAKALNIEPKSLISPKKDILMEDKRELILIEFSFLENHENYLFHKPSKSCDFVTYYFKHEGKENEYLKISIHRKLTNIFLSDNLYETRGKLEYCFAFEYPTWFLDLMQISYAKYFELQIRNQIEMNLYEVIIFALWKHNALFNGNRIKLVKEHTEILKELRDSNRLITRNEEIADTIINTLSGKVKFKTTKKTYYKIDWQH